MTQTRKNIRQEYLTKLALTTFYLSSFAFFVWKFSDILQDPAGFRLGPFDLALLGLATFRLGRLVAYDHVFEPFRRPFTRTEPDHTGAGDTVNPRGTGAQYSIGQLISCPICAGTWIAAALVYSLYLFPEPTRVFLAMAAAIGLAELLNGLVESLCWTAQLARTVTGEKEKAARQSTTPQGEDGQGSPDPVPGSYRPEVKNGMASSKEWKSN